MGQFILGAFLGVILGIFLTALMTAAKRNHPED